MLSGIVIDDLSLTAVQHTDGKHVLIQFAPNAMRYWENRRHCWIFGTATRIILSRNGVEGNPTLEFEWGGAGKNPDVHSPARLYNPPAHGEPEQRLRYYQFDNPVPVPFLAFNVKEVTSVELPTHRIYHIELDET